MRGDQGGGPERALRARPARACVPRTSSGRRHRRERPERGAGEGDRVGQGHDHVHDGGAAPTRPVARRRVRRARAAAAPVGDRLEGGEPQVSDRPQRGSGGNRRGPAPRAPGTRRAMPATPRMRREAGKRDRRAAAARAIRSRGATSTADQQRARPAGRAPTASHGPGAAAPTARPARGRAMARDPGDRGGSGAERAGRRRRPGRPSSSAATPARRRERPRGARSAAPDGTGSSSVGPQHGRQPPAVRGSRSCGAEGAPPAPRQRPQLGVEVERGVDRLRQRLRQVGPDLGQGLDRRVDRARGRGGPVADAAGARPSGIRRWSAQASRRPRRAPAACPSACSGAM